MKYNLKLIFLLFGILNFSPFVFSELEPQWITQKVDHFDSMNIQTWQMRFFENDAYYKDGGPILISLGGDWTHIGPIEEGHHVTDMAKEFNGILFNMDQRYYGPSKPTPNATTSNLQYLSTDQSLADLAHFIKHTKETRAELKDARVLIVGCSNEGPLAVWMRQKYPELVNGVWASSAPLHAKFNFVEYKEAMARSIELLGGKACVEIFRNAFSMMEAMVRRRDVEAMNTDLNLCTPLDVDNQLNVWSLFSRLSDDVATVVQRHEDRDIQEMCELLLEERHTDAFQAFAAWMKTRVSGCVEYDYQKIVNEMTKTDWDEPIIDFLRPWYYQSCTEFGWFQSSDSRNQPFGSSFPIELFYQVCKDLYGEEFTKARIDASMRRTNLLYGSFRPTATNVYYTYGELDPWSPMGVKEDISETAEVNVIPLVSHCVDVMSLSSSDSDELRESKLKATKLAKEWLGIK